MRLFGAAGVVTRVWGRGGAVQVDPVSWMLRVGEWVGGSSGQKGWDQTSLFFNFYFSIKST